MQLTLAARLRRSRLVLACALVAATAISALDATSAVAATSLPCRYRAYWSATPPELR